MALAADQKVKIGGFSSMFASKLMANTKFMGFSKVSEPVMEEPQKPTAE